MFLNVTLRGPFPLPLLLSLSFFLFSSKTENLEMKAWPSETNGSFPIQTPCLEERKENSTASLLSSFENIKQRTSHAWILAGFKKISAVKMLMIHPFTYSGFLKQEFSIFSRMFYLLVYFFVKLLPFQSGSKWIIFKTIINLKGEEGWLYSPAMHSKHWEMWRIWQGFCSPFFFNKRRVPWNEHPVRAFSKKGHNLYCSHFPQAVFKSPQSIWLA